MENEMPRTKRKRQSSESPAAGTTLYSAKERELDEITGAYRQAVVVLTANRLRLFDSLAKRPGTAGALARRHGLDERALTILLDALAALGLLTKKGRTYSCKPFAARYLASGSPLFIGNMIDHRFNLISSWIRLPDVVKKGSPVHPPEQRRSAKEHREFILAMADIGRRSAKKMLDTIDLAGSKNMLDLGGGPGYYAIAACRKHPGIHAVVFDLPETKPIAREEIRRAGMQKRIDVIGGDFLKGSFGSGYDLILISNIVHSLSYREMTRLFGKAHRAMAAGGRVIVKDFYIDEKRTSPVESALFAVNMLVRTKSGNCYTSSEISGALRKAGFTGIRRHRTAAVSILYVGRKRRA
jgi:predicted O-methyltransferase YrrM